MIRMIGVVLTREKYRRSKYRHTHYTIHTIHNTYDTNIDIDKQQYNYKLQTLITCIAYNGEKIIANK